MRRYLAKSRNPQELRDKLFMIGNHIEATVSRRLSGCAADAGYSSDEHCSQRDRGEQPEKETV